MFDFDKSGEIEKKELVMTFQTSIRALCKLVHIEPPSLNELEHFAEKLFLALDTDKSRSISFREFSEWMSNSWELQDFLLKYAMIQTYENANRRTREHITFYTKLFEAVSGGAQVQQVDSASIKIVFAKELKYMNEQLLQQLIKILEDSSKEFAKQNQLDIQDGMIYKEPFLEIMAAWSAFDATDINYDNETSITELKFLIYAFEGDIPDIFRVQDEMKILDKDNSGQVSRQEWISYLCLNPESQGKAVFRGNLKRLFNKFDSDNSGSLSVVEIKNLIKENLREYILKFRHRSKEDQADLDGMINTLVEQIMAELNSDNEKAITWVEFKHFMEKAYSKQETLKKFLAGI